MNKKKHRKVNLIPLRKHPEAEKRPVSDEQSNKS